MYNGSNIFAKQWSHNLLRKVQPICSLSSFSCDFLMVVAGTWRQLRLILIIGVWVISWSWEANCVHAHPRTVCMHIRYSKFTLPEVSERLQRREELVLNYNQVCVLPSFVLLIIPWARTVHNKEQNNKQLSWEEGRKVDIPRVENFTFLFTTRQRESVCTLSRRLKFETWWVEGPTRFFFLLYVFSRECDR